MVGGGEWDDTETVDDTIVTPPPTMDGKVSPAVAPERPERAQPFAGSRIGQYTVIGHLGRGGVGDVYRARDERLAREVAIKVLRGVTAAGARARLLAEAQAMAKLSHPNVVTVHEVGEIDDRVYLVMELVEGQTLSDWLAARPRSTGEVLSMFLQAGRGLAAAHQAGMVHRDFKPTNVLVGEDGRARVADFGLARPAELASTDSEGIAGTPAYMAPEQHLRHPVDARADQFAFCVALYQALYDCDPFDGDRYADLRDNVVANRVKPPPAGRAPGRLRPVVMRGLRGEPAERHPSMDALLQALGRRSWTSLRIVAAAGVVALAASAGAFFLGRGASVTACDGGKARAAALWSETARTRVRDALGRTGIPHAADIFAQVDASLRRRLAGWTDAYRDACEATQIRHEQSEAMLDRRMRCLGQVRSEIAAVISLLGEVDADRLPRATQAASEVGDFVPCSDVVSLGAAAPPPRDPERARRAEEVRNGLARLPAMRLLGKPAESLATARDLLSRAQELADGPLVAETLLGVANLEKSRDADAAIEKLYEAVRLAAKAGDEPLGARAATELVYALGLTKQRFEAAEVAYRLAIAAAARAGNSPAVLARLYGHRARVLYFKGEYAAALPLCHLVLALREQLYGPESLEVAMALLGLADTMTELGRAAEARATYVRALSVAERLVGPDHPDVLTILNNLGMALAGFDDIEGAAAVQERALAAKERIYPPDDLRIATGAHNLGMDRILQGRIEEGRALIERGYRIRLAKLGPDHPFIASSYDAFAQADRREGKIEAVHAYYEKALAIAIRALGPGHPKVADYLRLDASALLLQGRVAEARAAIDRALVIDERTIGAAHPTHQHTLRVLDEVVRAEKEKTVSRR